MRDLTLSMGFFAVAIAFTTYMVPSLPPFFEWCPEWDSELPITESLYFLPKSFIIVFQQLLIHTLVLTLCPIGITRAGQQVRIHAPRWPARGISIRRGDLEPCVNF
ncbi:hypothetical protein [Hoeflea alexandrii]|uniref:hypothetical protein n=1 Tax=Hoeflea alexandrii TaxID=288436 RepID=UPI0022AF6A36|nr:hypothetical protein [Hoeflea alexandrii]MCZ4287256.1 hypothetical protein [Hoeflea alexandrii]